MMFLAMFLAQVGESIQPQPQPIFWTILVQWILPLIPFLAFYILLAVCIWWAAIYFKNAGKEQKLIRLELGKLAEEVHQLRQGLKDGKDSNLPTVS